MQATTLPRIAHLERPGYSAMSHAIGCMSRIRSLFQALQSRRELATLDERMLSDIGVGRAEALHEAARAPWDIAPTR